MNEHRLKTWLEPFGAIEAGSKTFEYRKNDRDFRQGDLVFLDEWDQEAERFTGRRIVAEIGYLVGFPSFGMRDGHVAFSLLHVGDVETVAEGVGEKR